MQHDKSDRGTQEHLGAQDGADIPQQHDPIDDHTAPGDAWELLKGNLTESRQEKMLRVSSQRTRHVRLVVQDVHSPHNVSACLRSAEAFGLTDVDVVHLSKSFKPSIVGKGVHNWLRIHKYQSVEACVSKLRQEGYVLAAGMPTPDSHPLGDLPLDRKIAVVFGNEHEGVSEEWKSHIDYYFTIPMVGFVESLNISVSAAITMADLTGRARRALPPEQYFLSPEARLDLLNDWTCRQVESWPQQLKRLRVKPT